jgi:uncharacterized membrane protein YbhN (UPF0104 family)
MEKYRIMTRIIAPFLVTFVFYFLGKLIYTNWPEIKAYDLHINYPALSLSLVLLSMSFVMLALGWHLILRAVNASINPIDCVRIYMICQLARYIPGKIFVFVGRIIMAERKGVAKTLSTVSVLFEAIFSTAGAFIAMLIMYSLASDVQIDWIHPWKIGVLFVIGIAALNPKLINILISKTYKMRHKRPPDIKMPQFKYYKTVLLCLYYILLWMLMGLAFYVLVYSLIGRLASPKLAFDVACIFLFSWLAGFLCYVVPGGIGVREAVMTLSLKDFFPLPLVSIIAVVSRIWFILGELIGLAVVYLMPKSLSRME